MLALTASSSNDGWNINIVSYFLIIFTSSPRTHGYTLCSRDYNLKFYHYKYLFSSFFYLFCAYFITFFASFWNFILGSITIRPQPTHFILISAPSLITSNSLLPQGCCFFISTISPRSN